MNNYPPEYYEEDEIDIIGLLKYLWSNWLPILILGIAPVVLFVFLAFFNQTVNNKVFVKAVVKIEENLPDFQPNNLTSEALITSILEKKDWDINIQRLIRAISIEQGYQFLNNEINGLLDKLANEASLSRGQTLQSIQSKYDNLLAVKSNYLTVSIDLQMAGIEVQTAKVLLSELIEQYNEQFAAGQIPSSIVLSPVNLEDLNKMLGFNTYNVNNFQGLLFTLEDYIKKIGNLDYGRIGFNGEIIESRLKYIDYELRSLIASSPQMQTFFFEELDRVIEIQRNKITSIENALKELAKGKQSLSNSNENNNYSTELFDRFLDLGATVSQIEFQKELLQSKLKLEFELAEYTQRREKLAGYLNKLNDPELTYNQLIEETIELGQIINEFIEAYNQNYQAKFLNIIQLNQSKPNSVITPKTTGIILVLSLSLALFFFILKRSFSQKNEDV